MQDLYEGADEVLCAVHFVNTLNQVSDVCAKNQI